MKEKRRTLILGAACTAAVLLAGAAFALALESSRDAQPDSQKIDEKPTQRTLVTAMGTDTTVPPVQLTLVTHDQVKPASRITTTSRPTTRGGKSESDGGIAGGACGPGAGNCCSANGTPGCEIVSCCELVCGDDPFCCGVEWDDSCAAQAEASCPECKVVEECGSQGTGNCCENTGTPFCTDEECCNQICADDPFCCNVNWDQSCADQANDEDTGCEICLEPKGPKGVLYHNLPVPPGPLPAVIHEFDEILADDLQMVAGGFVDQLTISPGNFDAPSNLLSVDIEIHFWEDDLISAPVDGEQIAILVGTLDLTGVTGACGSPNPGLPPLCGFLGVTFTFAPIEFPQNVWAGVRYADATFAAGGGTENLFEFLGLADGPTVGASDDLLWSSTFNGTGGFIFFGGDPLANTAWEIGAGEGPEPLECGDPEAGSCFESNGTPACDDGVCCETVCACDPFCCGLEPGGFWDANCAGPNVFVPGCSALDLCDDTGDPTGACNISDCPADLNGDGNVGVPDLLALLAAWGPNPGHPADLNGDGNVGVPDLLALLAAWGSCPLGDCQILTENDCAAEGGDYQGDDSDCKF